MATIKDVSKKAGVSVATVSRVINNNYPVHENTRKKVLDAIDDLNYSINAVARGLKTKSTFLIGFVAPDISNPYFMEIAKGIEEIIDSKGYSLIFCSTDENEKKEIDLIQKLHEKQVDSIIVASRSKTKKTLNKFVLDGMKLIMIDTIVDGVKADIVSEDSYSASYNAINKGISFGHEKIAIICGNLSVSSGIDRLNAYRDALSDNNIDINNNYILHGEYIRDIAYFSVVNMFNRLDIKDYPTLIFSSNNYMTEGALIAIEEKHLKIPNDISIISFGNISIPALYHTKISHVIQSPHEIGIKAGNILLKRLSDKLPEDKFSKEIIDLSYKEESSVKQL